MIFDNEILIIIIYFVILMILYVIKLIKKNIKYLINFLF